MNQFRMKIDLISQRRQNVLFLPSSMAARTLHENALLFKIGVQFFCLAKPTEEHMELKIRLQFRHFSRRNA